MRRVCHSVKPTDPRDQIDGGELVAPVAGDVETEGMGEQTEVDAGSEEVRAIPGSRAPRQPTRAEVEDHRRSGCQPPVSILRGSARGGTTAHRVGQGSRVADSVHGLLCYLGSSREDDTRRYDRAKQRREAGLETEEEDVLAGSMPTLVVHDSRSTAVYGLVVGAKG